MSVLSEVYDARQKMVETARDMMGGTLSFIEGSRRINALRRYADLPDFDPDITPFVAIDSETDALPLGALRRHWQDEALVKLQPEIERAEAWAQKIGRDACQKLIERFAKLRGDE